MQAKQRKIRDKYGDQDEEERQMRMDILAVSHCGVACVLHCMCTAPPCHVVWKTIKAATGNWEEGSEDQEGSQPVN